MNDRMLPGAGELEIGSVRLPPGRRVGSLEYPDEPVAWATDEPVARPGRTWLALAEMSARTGLQPLLIPDDAPPGYSSESILRNLFRIPGDPDEIGVPEPAGILRDLWLEHYDEFLNDERLPFGSEFPGLADRTEERLTREQMLAALDRFEEARICLVTAGRPADMLVVTGWLPTDAFDTPVPISAVLRSWEDRFGARLVQAGPSAELRLLVERPPRTMAQAQHVAAEHWTFCGAAIKESAGERDDLTSITAIANSIAGNPVWGFWWD